MTETKPRSLGWGLFLLQFFTVAILYMLAQVPPVAIWGNIGPDGQLQISSTVMAGTTAFGMVVALFVAWLWLRKEGALAEAWKILPTEGWGKTLLVAFAATIAILGWFTLGTMVLEGIGLGTPAVNEVLGMVTESGFHYVLWVVLVALFAAGFGEELLYRGFLMDRLQRLKGIGSTLWGPIIVQGLIFGISHGYQSLAGVIITGVVGIGLGWLRTRVDSLMPLILAHMAVDTFSMSMAYADKLGMIPAFST